MQTATQEKKGYELDSAFWEKRLTGEYEEVLPGKAATGGQTTARYAHSLRGQGGEALLALTKGDDSALFVCVLASLAVVLKKYAGRDKLIVHSPAFGNPATPALQNVPLCLDVDSHATLREYLNAVSKTVKESYLHQDLPAYGTAAGQQGHGPELLLKYPAIHARETPRRYSLVIELQRGGEGVGLLFQYDAGVFSQAFIGNLAVHLSRVASCLTNLNQTIRDVDLLDEAEKKRLLSQSGNAGPARASDQTVVQLIEARAAQTPDAVAVQYGDRQLTYAELNRNANHLAGQLAERFAVGEEDIVGLMAENSGQLIVAILAVWKTGAAYLPIDPALPDERKQFFLTNADVKLLITESWLYFRQDYYGGDVFLLDMEPGGGTDDLPNPAAAGKASRLAYVIYTSGSTGQPKGVMLEHGGLVNMVLDQVGQFGIRETDAVLLFASISFDASVSEMCMALCAGARLVVPDRAVIKDDRLFLQGLRDAGVTVLTLPPSYLGAIAWQAFSFLRVIISAGEKLNAEAALALSRHADYFNAYGPTECTVCATIHKITPGMDPAVAESIGFPIANAQVLIMNADGQLMPEGLPGEMYVGGAGVARGYLKQPDLTAARFVPHPFGGRPGEKVYRTGDLGKWLPDGSIAFGGRNDEQVKLRGFRVELAEIEHVISQHDGVKQCTVLVKDNAPGNRQLIAFVASEGEFDPAQMTKYLSAKLPEYMVPSAWTVLPAFPLTHNKKVDKKKLLALHGTGTGGAAYAPPRNEVEEKLAKGWQELMGIPRVGIYDDFFKLGGDSLLAIRVVALIKEEFGLQVPMDVLFQFTNIAGLADYLSVVAAGARPAGGEESETILL